MKSIFPIIPVGPKYKDSRGTILMIAEKTDFKSASLIETKPNETRASHWHRADSHYCYVLNGEIWYYERPVHSQDRPIRTVINKGQLFFTAPLMEHEMFFPVNCSFLCLSTLSRSNVNYESDTERLTYKLKDIYEKVQAKT